MMEQVATSEGNATYRRRLVPIVDSRFQWKYTLLITALGVVVTAIMGVFLYQAHGETTRVLELTEIYQAEAIRNDQIFLLYLIVLVVVMGVALAFWGLIVTHRISGPLYIVARYLSVLGSGQYPDMRPLRKRDELHEFFAVFEEAVNAMRDRDKVLLSEIDAALSQAESGGTEALNSMSDLLRRHKESLEKAVGSAE